MATAVGCKVEKLKAKVAAAEFRCLTKPEIISYSFVWTLEDFLSICRPVDSKIFPRDGKPDVWIFLNPNIDSGRAMQVGLKLPTSPGLEFKVSIVNTNYGRCQTWKMVKECETEEVGLKLVTWKELWGSHADFICDGALTLLCEIRFVRKVVSLAMEKSSERIFYDSVLENLLDRLIVGGNVDACLKFGNYEMYVNMDVLSARSPFFRSLFAEKVKKGSSLLIIIDIDCKGVDQGVLREMIHFMKTGSTPKLKNLALQLMQAAEKFKVETLKKVCEDHFRDQLDVNNVIDTYIAAIKCSADNLKAFTSQFIRLHYKKVSKTDRWMEAVEEQKEQKEIAPLINDVLQVSVEDVFQEASSEFQS